MTDQPPNRRAQRRAETLAEIVAVAEARLAAEGPSGLAIRGIAADMGLSPGALYRYVDGLDAILTELITKGYRSLARAIASAHDEASDPVDQLRVCAHAYRDWARAHPHRFNLLFGSPIAGYAAPVDGPTAQAMSEVSSAFFRPAFEAVEGGRIVIPAPSVLDDEPQGKLHAVIESIAGLPVPPGFGVWATQWWATVHGLVALELNGQFQWLYGDDAEPQFDAAIEGQLATVRVR